MRLLYKNFIYEAVQKGQDLYLEPGTTLFHGTGEEIEGDLRPGGYDSLLWTTDSSIIAQSYIPVAGITSYTQTSSFTKPSKNLEDAQKQLGIVFDANYDERGHAKSFATIAPQEFKDANENNRKALRKLIELEKESNKIKEEMKIRYKNKYEFSEEDKIQLDKDIETENNIIANLKSAEEAYRNSNPDVIKNRYVNKKLEELGYKPSSKDYNENYQWKLKEENNKILPADYRVKGKLYIIKLKRKMKIYDMAMGNEPDLTERQYHELETFQWARENGYDGVKINDFAQTETHGNVGHTSYGFFKDSIKDLDIKSIDNVSHPKDIRGMHSEEYRKYLEGEKNAY